jgi:hypothetical protein
LLTIPGVCYIPDLAESIYSLFQHLKSPDHGLHSSFEGGLTIIFPSFQMTAIIGKDDVYLDACPIYPDSSTDLNDSTTTLVPPQPTISLTMC